MTMLELYRAESDAMDATNRGGHTNALELAYYRARLAVEVARGNGRGSHAHHTRRMIFAAEQRMGVAHTLSKPKDCPHCGAPTIHGPVFPVLPPCGGKLGCECEEAP